jgi:Protein of unknown function (DUF1501)
MKPMNSAISRRHLLASSGLGLGSIALATLLRDEGLLAAESKPPLDKPDLIKPTYDLKPKVPGIAPRARGMISMFMQGGPSQMDLLDPKPKLNELDGQKFPGEVKYDNAAQASSKVLGSPWKFARQGECGTEVSELLPNLAGVADDITVIRSMFTGVSNHGQSIDAMHTGRPTSGRPVLGSWMGYGLGTESQDLPAFAVLTDPASLPVLGVANWSAGWLPSLFQGTVIRPREPRILNLDPPPHLRGAPQEQYLSFLAELNRKHLEQHPGELDLEARIASYELAARMQSAAKEAVDLSRESEATHRLYGLDDPATKDFGSRCLIARRLIERGVRFVQLFTSNQFWDHHGSIRTALPNSCKKIDRGSAALVQDLKQRGLLDSTIVHWGGEMGRLPVVQNDAGPDKVGRDHNTYGFSMWMAGGGFKRGYVHGATDEFGHKVVEGLVNHFDYHATLLHLFGLDHTRLAFKRNGQFMTLTDQQPGRVMSELLA